MEIHRTTSAVVSAAVTAAADGDTRPIETLYADAQATGGPTVDAGDGAGPVAVTFWWRGAAERVVLVGLCDFRDLRRTELMPVAGTDLWCLTVELPARLRAGYGFAIDDPVNDLLDDDVWDDSARRWRPDPINPTHLECRCNTDGIEPEPAPHTFSVLALPGAVTSSWTAVDPGVPAGELTMHWMRRAETGLPSDHRIWSYVPAGLGDGPHPVAVLFDGDCYVGPLVTAPTTLDNLIAAKRIPPTVVLLVDSLAESRTEELGGNPDFVDFLADRLLPWAAERWPVTADPARTLLGGSSLGGFCSAYGALRRPERFGLVLSQSGAFYHRTPELPDGLAAAYAAPDPLATRWYLDAGTLETSLPKDYDTSILESNRHLRSVLDKKGYSLRYAEFVGGHDYACWQETLSDGFVELLGG